MYVKFRRRCRESVDVCKNVSLLLRRTIWNEIDIVHRVCVCVCVFSKICNPGCVRNVTIRSTRLGNHASFGAFHRLTKITFTAGLLTRFCVRTSFHIDFPSVHCTVFSRRRLNICSTVCSCLCTTLHRVAFSLLLQKVAVCIAKEFSCRSATFP